jgi:glutathione S-transferase
MSIPTGLPLLTLHEDPISQNCYKIRLTASLLNLPLIRKKYDIKKGETQTPFFQNNISLARQIPVLQVGDVMLPESNAACFFLADQDGSVLGLAPKDRFHRAEMLRWMFFEQNQHETSIAVLRSWLHITGYSHLSESQKSQIEVKRAQGIRALDIMEAHLKDREWFVGDGITLADVVLFAYTAVAQEGGFEMQKYPYIEGWLGRVRRTKGWLDQKE